MSKKKPITFTSIEHLVEHCKTYEGTCFGQAMFLLSKRPILTDELLERTTFLNNMYQNVSMQQRLYHVWFDVYSIELCPVCNAPRAWGKRLAKEKDNHREGNYRITCGKKECNAYRTAALTKETLLNEYGVSHVSQIQGIQEKIWNTRKEKGEEYAQSVKDKRKATNLEKYGVEHGLQSTIVQAKGKQTSIEKYGVEYAVQSDIIKNKIQSTNLEKYGHMCSLRSPDVQAKLKANCLAKYGAEHYLQNPAEFDKKLKTKYKKRNYVFPSGRTEMIQGYEHFALNDLLKLGFEESDIIVSSKQIVSEIGDLWYYVADKKHRYYPDIYVRSINKIIEVKCKYTSRMAIYVNELKRQSVIDKGVDFEFWIYDEKGNRIANK